MKDNNVLYCDFRSAADIVDAWELDNVKRAERAEKKAEQKARMSEKKKRESGDRKKRIIAIGATVAILFAAGYAGSYIQRASDERDISKVVSDALAPYSSTIVSENTHRTQGNQNIWYDNVNIGKEIVESDDDIENFDLENALFKTLVQTYPYVSDNAPEIFDSIKRYAAPDDFTAAFGGATSFNGYVKNLGCVDENGNFDYDGYVDTMRERVYAKAVLDGNNETLKEMADAANNKAVKASNQDNAGKGGK